MSTPQEKALEKKLDRVLYILENDSKTNRKGLVEDVADMKVQIDSVIFNQKMFVAKVAFLGVIGGALFTFFVWFYDKVI